MSDTDVVDWGFRYKTYAIYYYYTLDGYNSYNIRVP